MRRDAGLDVLTNIHFSVDPIENDEDDRFIPDYDDLDYVQGEDEDNYLSDEENGESSNMTMNRATAGAANLIAVDQLTEDDIHGNPALMNVMKQMVQETVQAAATTGSSEPEQALISKTQTGVTTRPRAGKVHHDYPVNMVKSPSDTTIYAPALGLKKMRELF